MRFAQQRIAGFSLAVLLGLACSTTDEKGATTPKAAVPAKIPEVRSRSNGLDLAAGTVDFVAPATEATIPLVSRVCAMIEATVNAGTPGEFLLDTGSVWSMFHPELAKHLKLPTRSITPILAGTVAHAVSFESVARLDSVSMGTAIVRDLDAALIDSPARFAVIGVEVLAQYPVLFDAPNGSVRILNRDDTAGALCDLFPEARWTRLPLTWDGLHPIVEIAYGQSRLRFFLDTGANLSALSLETLQRLDLHPIGTQTAVEVDAAGASLEEDEVYSVPGLRVGGWCCNLESKALESGFIESRLDGLLGFDLLGQFAWVFDAPASALWVIEPAEDERFLESTREKRLQRAFDDPYPYFRGMAAFSTGTTRNLRFVGNVAALLDDPVPEVRMAAAVALAEIAGKKNWSTPVLDAKVWWLDHKNDPAFAR